MPKIFICYRREDSEYIAQQIKDRMVERFGNDSIIFDTDSFDLGVDFRHNIEKEVAQCDVLLTIIGNNWLRILNERLKDPKDFVRLELEAGLARKIAVVPVVVGQAVMPQEKDLPKTLRNLVYRNAAEVRGGLDLEPHIDRLVNTLDKMLRQEAPTVPDRLASPTPTPHTFSLSSSTTTAEPTSSSIPAAESTETKKSGCATVIMKFFAFLAVVAVIAFVAIQTKML